MPRIRRRRTMNSRQEPKRVGKATFAFTSGILIGVLATMVVLFFAAVGALNYMKDQAANSATFAMLPDKASGENRVELYFPLERFLSWRSTHQILLGMTGDRVHAQIVSQIIPQLHFNVSIDIFGTPGVSNGYFSLTNLAGYVDHIPVPRTLLLGAIASDGEKYGVHVNSARDSLLIEKNFGSYKLVGYDDLSRDLVISLPVSAVEKAARGQAFI